jgi:hypothetical protein
MAKDKKNLEKQWMAESDARTLAEAQRIIADKGRFKAAKDAALKLANDYEKSATNMKLAAGGKSKK